jgi:hypothetical protein
MDPLNFWLILFILWGFAWWLTDLQSRRPPEE